MSKIKGWTVNETIGIGIINTRAINSLSIQTINILLSRVFDEKSLYLFKDSYRKEYYISYTQRGFSNSSQEIKELREYIVASFKENEFKFESRNFSILLIGSMSRTRLWEEFLKDSLEIIKTYEVING